MPRAPHSPPPDSGAILAQLTTSQLCRIRWAPEDPDGAYLYLYRLCGIVRRVAARETVGGPRLRLKGKLVAGAGPHRWSARSAIVPPAIADAVQVAFAEHPPSSTRDRITVHVDFDLWAIRDRSLALGYRLHCEGRAIVPHPLSALVAQSFSRPVPASPTLET